MSNFARQRKKRLRGFESRCTAPADVRRYRHWRYVTVHPFADEPELLRELEMRPEDCSSADVWWNTGRDVVLLQLVACQAFPCTTTLRWFGSPAYWSIVARFPGPVATLENLHRMMDRIATQGIPKRGGNRGIVIRFPTETVVE